MGYAVMIEVMPIRPDKFMWFQHFVCTQQKQQQQQQSFYQTNIIQQTSN